MKIDLLYFDDCPSWKVALQNLEKALSEEQLEADINLVLVASNEDAQRNKFLGSPSFHVEGEDWWPEERDNYKLSCRVYPTTRGMQGAPTVDMLRSKLRSLADQ